MNMDTAVFALLKQCQNPRATGVRKEMAWVKLVRSCNNEEPLIDGFDAYAMADYARSRNKCKTNDQHEITRSASEATLFTGIPLEERISLSRASTTPSALKKSIKKGVAMLPGNIVLMKAAQCKRKHQIDFGVKSSVGHRPRMEDSHIITPFFFRFPISLDCTQQLIPDYLKSELDKATGENIDESYSWSSMTTEMQPPRADSVHCVFDDFDLFLICDGHGGAQVSNYCTANFKKILKKELKMSVEERYLELLESQQEKLKPTMSVPPSLENIPERSSKSASNLDESTSAQSSRILSNSQRRNRRLQLSESVRERSIAAQTADTRCISTKNGLPAAQMGLNVLHIKKCISRTFNRLDAEVKDQKLGDFEGSTALAVLVGSWHIAIANCGDSRAVLCRNGTAIRLTRDHKPYIEEERMRIERSGGFVLNAYGCSRVNGFLAMSRAIGDHLLPAVISDPDVSVLHRHRQDEFLICATDGLWDVMTDAEACDMTTKCLARAEAKGARKLSARVAANVLLKAALDKGSTDNITIAVVDLRMKS